MKKKDSLRSPQQCIKNKLITLRFIFSLSSFHCSLLRVIPFRFRFFILPSFFLPVFGQFRVPNAKISSLLSLFFFRSRLSGTLPRDAAKKRGKRNTVALTASVCLFALLCIPSPPILFHNPQRMMIFVRTLQQLFSLHVFFSFFSFSLFIPTNKNPNTPYISAAWFYYAFPLAKLDHAFLPTLNSCIFVLNAYRMP